MSDIDDNLNDILNIVPEVIEPTEIATVETQIAVPEDKDAEVDLIQAVRIYIRC